jgi:hypothetical protein
MNKENPKTKTNTKTKTKTKKKIKIKVKRNKDQNNNIKINEKENKENNNDNISNKENNSFIMEEIEIEESESESESELEYESEYEKGIVSGSKTSSGLGLEIGSGLERENKNIEKINNNYDNNNNRKIKEKKKRKKKAKVEINTVVLLDENNEEVLDEDGNRIFINENTGEEIKVIRKNTENDHDINKNKNGHLISQPIKDVILLKFENSIDNEIIEIKNINSNLNLNDNDITKMVAEKRKKMNLHLLKVISEERIKEEKRELLYVNCIDSKKKILQNKFSIERRISEQKIERIDR